MKMTNVILTVDAVITVKREKILLIKRAHEPFTDKLVLPGGHLEATDKRLVDACVREAAEEIGLIVQPEELKFLTVLDDPDRDPRPGRRISIVFFLDLKSEDCLKTCQAGSDAASLTLIPIESLTEEMLGFDHWQAVKHLR
jgi:ADP-ribose pyrophosphatase YjhB (NUDIX family)